MEFPQRQCVERSNLALFKVSCTQAFRIEIAWWYERTLLNDAKTRKRAYFQSRNVRVFFLRSAFNICLSFPANSWDTMAAKRNESRNPHEHPCFKTKIESTVER